MELQSLPGFEALELHGASNSAPDVSVLRGNRSDLILSGARLAPSSGDAMRLTVEAALRRPRDESGASLSASGVDLALRNRPSTGALCDWMRQADALQMRDLSLSMRMEGSPGVGTVSVGSLSFRREGGSDACALEGVTILEDVKLLLEDGSGFVFSRAAFRLSLSGAGGAAPGVAVLSGVLSGFEWRRSGEVPTFGIPEAQVRISVMRDSLAPMMAWLERLAGQRLATPTDLDVMQAWNVFTALEAQMDISAPVLRIYAPGAVPAEMVANFSRAGLSTISGSAGVSIDLSDRVLDASFDLSLTGLVDASVKLLAKALPYVREKLESAAAGRDIGLHLIPDLLVSGASLTWRDTGLDRAVVDITGVPAGRQMEEIAALSSGGGGDPEAVLLGASAGFLRQAADGSTLVVRLSPDEPRTLASLLFAFLTAPLDAARDAGLTLSR
jgi:hypothetical protein